MFRRNLKNDQPLSGRSSNNMKIIFSMLFSSVTYPSSLFLLHFFSFKLRTAGVSVLCQLLRNPNQPLLERKRRRSAPPAATHRRTLCLHLSLAGLDVTPAQKAGAPKQQDCECREESSKIRLVAGGEVYFAKEEKI